MEGVGIEKMGKKEKGGAARGRVRLLGSETAAGHRWALGDEGEEGNGPSAIFIVRSTVIACIGCRVQPSCSWRSHKQTQQDVENNTLSPRSRGRTSMRRTQSPGLDPQPVS
ncbi:hypothetical protein N7447_006149 [Penicillium robsamsonii]|uniref:uncharacterized protein n=1 Tax=Penicillium robsamsonii TaxID=1792511 RepID=UPI002546650F|nr:uncharacterized protein N7447_006149 [Penicillium robsamsonii]KAJ5823809.1 hypothetical protein N7447_006149 [Penicillium robsamsonii]